MNPGTQRPLERASERPNASSGSGAAAAPALAAAQASAQLAAEQAPMDAPLRTAAGPGEGAARVPSWFERRLRERVHARLAGLREGELALVEDGQRRRFGAADAQAELRAEVIVRDPALWTDIALRGSIGAAEAYFEGKWDCSDLAALTRLFVRNREALVGLEGGLARVSAPLQRLRHLLRGNTRSGARRNIAAHYDLSNELYALFLDPSLSYSSAYFAEPHFDLERAQLAKIDRLLDWLELGPRDHLLEIGTGWGALALRAAQRHGCRVTSTTISQAQLELARERVARAGLSERVELLFCDYRELRGRYDKLVSVEMIEAVGAEHLGTYFHSCSRLLAPHGLFALQAIVIADQLYEQAARSTDVIQRYVFPGSCIPSNAEILQRTRSRTDFALVRQDDLSAHYARTLHLWRERFLAQREQVRALGFDRRFERLWEYYLAYCEGGFAERQLGLSQLLFAKPRWRPRA